MPTAQKLESSKHYWQLKKCKQKINHSWISDLLFLLKNKAHVSLADLVTTSFLFRCEFLCRDSVYIEKVSSSGYLLWLEYLPIILCCSWALFMTVPMSLSMRLYKLVNSAVAIELRRFKERDSDSPVVIYVLDRQRI